MADAPAPELRTTGDREVLGHLAAGSPLALAEVLARTLPVAAAVLRRMLPAPTLEPALDAVYRSLWEAPPDPDHPETSGPLLRLARARAFDVGLARLQACGAGPVAPSVRAAAPDLPASEPAYLDATERRLGALDEPARRAVVLAHDRGLPSDAQDDRDAGRALVHGLLAVADAEDEVFAPADLDRRAGDLVLGLLDPAEAAEVAASLDDPSHGPDPELVRALRRGRRRLEGLPPAAEVGLRLLATLLAGAAPRPSATSGVRATAATSLAPGGPDEPAPRERAAPVPAGALDSALGDTAAEADLRVAAFAADAGDADALPSVLRTDGTAGHEDAAAAAQGHTHLPPAPRDPPPGADAARADRPPIDLWVGAEPEGQPRPDLEEGRPATRPPPAGRGAPPRSRRRRALGLLGGLVLIAVGVALGLFVIGPLLAGWLSDVFG